MIKVKFGADEYPLKSTWKSSIEFADLIGDPLQMAQRGVNGSQEFTLETATRAIWIGMKAAGSEMTYTEVGTLCHKHGVINYLNTATEYLIYIVSADDADDDVNSGTKKKK